MKRRIAQFSFITILFGMVYTKSASANCQWDPKGTVCGNHAVNDPQNLQNYLSDSPVILHKNNLSVRCASIFAVPYYLHETDFIDLSTGRCDLKYFISIPWKNDTENFQTVRQYDIDGRDLCAIIESCFEKHIESVPESTTLRSNIARLSPA